MYIGISNYFSYYALDQNSKLINDFWLFSVRDIREFYLQYCNKDRLYINAAFNQVYINGFKCDYEKYFSKIESLFLNRKIIVFSGEGILKNLEYDVFRLAKERIDIYCKNRNAYDDFDEIYQKALSYSADEYTLIFMIGPVSKVLVYELTKKGYLAWDTGHLAEDYNAYKKLTVRSDKNIKEFFVPY